LCPQCGHKARPRLWQTPCNRRYPKGYLDKEALLFEEGLGGDDMRNYAQQGTHRTGIHNQFTVVETHPQLTQSLRAPSHSGVEAFAGAWKRLHLLVLLFFLAGSTIHGQNTVGAIVGTATAADGSTVAGVTITITNEGTHAARTVTAGEHGGYAVPDLNPGSYDLRASAPGFNSIQSLGIVVLSQQTVRIDIPLKVGSVATQVVVTGGTPVIENEMPSISTTVTSEEITRTSSNLLGTKDNTGDSGLEEYIALLPAGHNGSGSSWSMNGSTTGEAYYNVDGISSNSTLYGNADGPAFPSYDIVQEVKYDSVNNKAEMGQLLNITVITKSGTDNFHGSLFEHFGNEDLQAQSYFSQTNPPYTDNDFGGGVGGPILKRKLYFFAAYEGLRR
jgi:hypothetical protein